MVGCTSENDSHNIILNLVHVDVTDTRGLHGDGEDDDDDDDPGDVSSVVLILYLSSPPPRSVG